MEGSIDKILQTLQTKLKQLDLNQISVKYEQSADSSSFRKAKYACDIEKSILIEGELNKEQKSKLAPINEIVESLKGELSKIDNDQTKITNKVKCQIKLGDTFNTIDKIYDFQGNEKSLQHQQGQVMLIDFWATWCGPCQMPMQHNQDMLTKNSQKWGNKVQIVGLGMDDGVEALKKRVDDKNWNKITHYHMKGGFKHPTASNEYCISGIPHVALFDKQGKLLFKGHPSEVNLENWISCLVDDKEFAQKKQKQPGDMFEDIPNCIDFQGNNKTLKHDGKVLMIDFWATWCGPCQKPMQHNQDMIIKNEKLWDGKVRIVGLSMDDSIEDAKNRVSERKWDKIEHYQLQDGFENEVAGKDYKVEGIPNIVIFGKDGKLLYQGHPSSIPLEESLTKLANNEEVKFPSKGEEEDDKGNTNAIKNTIEIFKNLESVNQKEGPLSNIDDSKKPWFIITDSVKYFLNGTHSQQISIMRRQPAPEDETAKKFVGVISNLAKEQDIQIRDV